MKSKSLYVCYVRLNYDYITGYLPVYCYASDPCHATNLAKSFCVDCWHWDLNSTLLKEPIIVENFIM